MRIENKYQKLVILFLHFLRTDSSCTFPTALDGNWYDSNFNGVITVARITLKISSGWSYSVYSQAAMTSYTCEDSDDSTWLFRSDTTSFAYGANYSGFLCINYKKITDYSYMYYINNAEEPEAQFKRIRMVPEGDYNSGKITTSQICDSTSGPGTEEYHVLVKAANVADVKQFFPSPLLGSYAYSVNDGSSTSCGTGSVWDDCTNRTTMAFNYTQCNTPMFGSANGVLYGVHSVTSGSTSYVIVIDSDGQNSNMFTCLAVSGTSVSSNPGSCAKQQSASSRTSDPSSVLITLTAYELCPFTDPSTEPASSNLIIIIAVVVVLVLIIAIIVGIMIWYRRKHKRFPCQKNKVENLNKDKKAEKSPPDDAVSPRSAVDMDLPKDKKTLPPLSTAPPLSEVNGNAPLPNITRQ